MKIDELEARLSRIKVVPPSSEFAEKAELLARASTPTGGTWAQRVRWILAMSLVLSLGLNLIQLLYWQARVGQESSMCEIATQNPERELERGVFMQAGLNASLSSVLVDERSDLHPDQFSGRHC